MLAVVVLKLSWPLTYEKKKTYKIEKSGRDTATSVANYGKSKRAFVTYDNWRGRLPGATPHLKRFQHYDKL